MLALAGTVALGLEAWGFVSSIRSLSSTRSRIEAARVQMEKDQSSYQRLASYVDPARLKSASAEAQNVKSYIERRTFDWEALFSALEKLQPDAVRLTSIDSSFGSGTFTIRIQGNAKSLAVQNEFVDKLEKSEAFSQAYIASQRASGSEIEFALQTDYDLAPRRTAGRSRIR